MTVAASAFELRAVLHLIRPWGTPAQNLDELLRGIATAPVEVLFRHAVQHQLRHPGAEELPPDDFSAWIGGVVQDAETAERLRFEVQGGITSETALRNVLLTVLNSVPEKRRIERDAPEGSGFSFLSATSLSYPTGTFVEDGEQLVESLVEADPGVWFFHLIEEPFFGEEHAPLLDWLSGAGHDRLAKWLAESAHAGLPIDKARAKLLRRWRQSRIGRRVAEATELPEDARREVGRQAVARLVRRHQTSEEAP